MKKRMLTIGLGAIALLYACPMLLMLCFSFMSNEELAVVIGERIPRLIPYWATWSGYFDLLFASRTYMDTFWNSLLIAAAVMVIQTGFSLVMAFVLAKLHFRGKRAVLYLYVIMMMMPFQATLLPNYLMTRWLDLYNTWWALILPGAFTPFSVFLLYQFIRKSMPNELIYATLVETSSPWVMLFRVVLPVVRPGVVAAAVLAFADGWNMVEQPLILLQDEWLYPLSLALNQAQADRALTFTGSVLYVLPMVLVYFFVEDELIQGVSALGG